MDPATARRFLFEVHFLPMNARQMALAFHRAFGVDCPADIVKLDALTPGDFAVVARKAAAIGEHNPLQLAKWLRKEVSTKPEGQKIKIGF